MDFFVPTNLTPKISDYSDVTFRFCLNFWKLLKLLKFRRFSEPESYLPTRSKPESKSPTCFQFSRPNDWIYSPFRTFLANAIPYFSYYDQSISTFFHTYRHSIKLTGHCDVSVSITSTAHFHISLTTSVNTSLYPSADETHHLGALGNKWDDLYIDDIYIYSGTASSGSSVSLGGYFRMYIGGTSKWIPYYS